MSITRERFEQGMTYEQYKEQMTRSRERLEANEQTVALDPEVVAFFAEQPPMHVVALAEDWCGDVIANLPVLGRLAEASGTLDVRVFLRDQNLDLMGLYLKDGKHQSIPVFAFFDADFNALGHFIERPAAISALQEQMKSDLYANDPLFAGVDPDGSFALLSDTARARLMRAFTEFRNNTREQADLEVQRELRALVEQSTVAV